MSHKTYQLIKLSQQLVSQSDRFWFRGMIVGLSGLLFFAMIEPAMAHHAMDNATPTNFWQGFLSGLAHPIIGLDHFAFVVAMGLIGAMTESGFVTPLAFLMAAMAGTGLHIASVDMPAPEIVIAASVISFGIILVKRIQLTAPILAALAATAGLFHGYAYGESIIGANMTPLFAYLAGFTIIQGVIAGAAMNWMRLLPLKSTQQPATVLKTSGLIVSAIGVVFLSKALMG